MPVTWALSCGIERALSRFADDTKLLGSVVTLEGRDDIQGNLDTCERYADDNLMKFSKAKCIVLHLWVGAIQGTATGWEEK